MIFEDFRFVVLLSSVSGVEWETCFSGGMVGVGDGGAGLDATWRLESAGVGEDTETESLRDAEMDLEGGEEAGHVLDAGDWDRVEDCRRAFGASKRPDRVGNSLGLSEMPFFLLAVDRLDSGDL